MIRTGAAAPRELQHTGDHRRRVRWPRRGDAARELPCLIWITRQSICAIRLAFERGYPIPFCDRVTAAVCWQYEGSMSMHTRMFPESGCLFLRRGCQLTDWHAEWMSSRPADRTNRKPSRRIDSATTWDGIRRSALEGMYPRNRIVFEGRVQNLPCRDEARTA